MSGLPERVAEGPPIFSVADVLRGVNTLLEERVGRIWVAGEVSETGSAVTRVKTGDRVAVNPSLPCWQCRGCQAGR